MNLCMNLLLSIEHCRNRVVDCAGRIVEASIELETEQASKQKPAFRSG